MERWSKLPRWAMVGQRCSHRSPTRWARMRVVASQTPKHGWRQGSVATSTSAHCKRAKPVHLHRPISLSHPRSWRPARGWHLNRRRNQMNPSLTSSWIKGKTRWVATPWNHYMRVLAVRRHKPWHVQCVRWRLGEECVAQPCRWKRSTWIRLKGAFWSFLHPWSHFIPHQMLFAN
jgi:hypothetical protein